MKKDSRWDDCLLQGLICVPLAWLKPPTSLWLWPTSLLWPLKGWTQIFNKQSSLDVFAELIQGQWSKTTRWGCFSQWPIYFRPFVGVTLYYWYWLNDLVEMILILFSEWPKNLHVVAETPTQKNSHGELSMPKNSMRNDMKIECKKILFSTQMRRMYGIFPCMDAVDLNFKPKNIPYMDPMGYR